MTRAALLALALLAGCAGRDTSGRYPTADEFQKRHPEWPREDCERLAAGKIWAGMTEKQFLYQMRRSDRSIVWTVIQCPNSRVYRRDGTDETYLIDGTTGRLTDWALLPR